MKGKYQGVRTDEGRVEAALVNMDVPGWEALDHHHRDTPDVLMMEREEVNPELDFEGWLWRLRLNVFGDFLGYVFGEGVGVVVVIARLQTWADSFCGEWLQVREVRPVAELEAWDLEEASLRLVEELFERECRERILSHLVRGRGWKVDWEAAARNLFGVMKAMNEERLGNPSLSQLGVMFGDENLKAAKSRWSHLVQRVWNQPLEAVGANGRARFQVSDEVREGNRVAQLGNRNRLGG